MSFRGSHKRSDRAQRQRERFEKVGNVLERGKGACK
jgi:hypothetical protein